MGIFENHAGKLALLGKTAREPIAGVVTNSTEFQRIFALPRRVLDLHSTVEQEQWNQKLRVPNGSMRLWPLQAISLEEAAKANGLFAPLGVGAGKTLIALLLPHALKSKKAVLLVKPDLKAQMLREMHTRYKKNFVIPEGLHIVAYSELSGQNKAGILEEIKPDLIISDECHCLKRKTSARTKRFLRYFSENPGTRLCALSGTITSRSVVDYAHLLELCLRKNSPLPKGYRELVEWSGALDVKPDIVYGPGVLKKFCNEGENVREGFRRRLTETLGVVASDAKEVGSSLVVREIDPGTSLEVMAQIKQARLRWRIGDEEFDDAVTRARVLRELACGFYYRWVWPGGIKNQAWIDARAAWSRDVRNYLQHRAKPGMDSPGLLLKAAMKGIWTPDSWQAWSVFKDVPEPPKEPVWISDYFVDRIVDWGQNSDPHSRSDVPSARHLQVDETSDDVGNTRSIIWYEFEALGERVAKAGGFPLYGPGTDIGLSRDRVIVASLAANGTGKNAQWFNRMLFPLCPSSGATLEQAIGRAHREGQDADTVQVDFFGHTEEMKESFERCLTDAKYVQESTGQKQKLLFATVLRSEDK